MKFQQIKGLLAILFIVCYTLAADAQCAMCKTSAEQSAYASKLNTGILYLLFAPVVVLGGVLIFWRLNKDKFSNHTGE